MKELGFLIGLHTGGYRPKHLAEVLPLVDWIGFDVKAPFEREKYKTAVGGADYLHEAEESLKLLTESGVDFECRTTCDPRILTIEDIYIIAGELKAREWKSIFWSKSTARLKAIKPRPMPIVSVSFSTRSCSSISVPASGYLTSVADFCHNLLKTSCFCGSFFL